LLAVDWGEVAAIAGAGLGMVVIVLAILAIATWIAGKLLNRIDSKREKQSSQQQTEG
jgi:Na+-transporting methylmalonyl-CoA/oxaloacetate decarboxylase gamma subunit